MGLRLEETERMFSMIGMVASERASEDGGRREGMVPLGAVRLLGAESGRIRRLKGFVKGAHFEPDGHHAAALGFVRKIGAEEVSARAEALYRELREAFGWKRRDLSYSCESGLAIVQTPRFSVELSVDQDPEDPKRFGFWTTVSSFRDSEILLDPTFVAVFRDSCRIVEIDLPKAVDVEAQIDLLEENDRIGELLDYPPDAAWLSLQLPAPAVRMELRTDLIRFHLPVGGDLEQLLEGTFRLLDAVGVVGTRWLLG